MVYGVDGGAFRGAEEEQRGGGPYGGGVALSVVLKDRGAPGNWSSKPSQHLLECH